MNISYDQCSEMSDILKTISHPARLMILCQLAESPKTVSELETLCNTSQSQVSQFLNRMRREKMVIASKVGRYVFYSISDKNMAELLNSMHSIYCAPITSKRPKAKKKDHL